MLFSDPRFQQQLPQLGAALLAACGGILQPALLQPLQQRQVLEAQARLQGDDTTSDVLSLQPAAAVWAGLPTDAKRALLESRRRAAIAAARRRPYALQRELLVLLRDLGVRCRANALTKDGCTCIDVAATLPSGAHTPRLHPKGCSRAPACLFSGWRECMSSWCRSNEDAACHCPATAKCTAKCIPSALARAGGNVPQI